MEIRMDRIETFAVVGAFSIISIALIYALYRMYTDPKPDPPAQAQVMYVQPQPVSNPPAPPRKLPNFQNYTSFDYPPTFSALY